MRADWISLLEDGLFLLVERYEILGFLGVWDRFLEVWEFFSTSPAFLFPAVRDGFFKF